MSVTSDFLKSNDRQEITIVELTPRVILSGFEQDGSRRYNIAFSNRDRGVFRELIGVSAGATHLEKAALADLADGKWAYDNGKIYVQLTNNSNPAAESLVTANVVLRFATDSVISDGHYYKPWVVGRLPGVTEKDSEQGLFAIKTADSGIINILNVDGWWSITASPASSYIWNRTGIRVKIGGSFGTPVTDGSLDKCADSLARFSAVVMCLNIAGVERAGLTYQWTTSVGGLFTRPDSHETILIPPPVSRDITVACIVTSGSDRRIFKKVIAVNNGGLAYVGTQGAKVTVLESFLWVPGTLDSRYGLDLRPITLPQPLDRYVVTRAGYNNGAAFITFGEHDSPNTRVNPTAGELSGVRMQFRTPSGARLISKALTPRNLSNVALVNTEAPSVSSLVQFEMLHEATTHNFDFPTIASGIINGSPLSTLQIHAHDAIAIDVNASGSYEFSTAP